MKCPGLIWMPLIVAASGCFLPATATADEILCDCPPPGCGKVCKLVCATKKLTATCYGCECKDICIPDPSRRGCKHCAECYGKCAPDTRTGCENHPPKCEFGWRDWFACGCAQPRSVRVLTKYQAEKEICWYHWEVVDAACCDCVSKNGAAAGAAGASGPADKDLAKQARRTFYKPAPDTAHIGDVLAVSEAEWVHLAAVLKPDPTDVSATSIASSSINPGRTPVGEPKPADDGLKAPSIAERFQRLLKK